MNDCGGTSLSAREVHVLFFGDSHTVGVGDPSGLGWVRRTAAATHAAGTPLVAYNLEAWRRSDSRRSGPPTFRERRGAAAYGFAAGVWVLLTPRRRSPPSASPLRILVFAALFAFETELLRRQTLAEFLTSHRIVGATNGATSPTDSSRSQPISIPRKSLETVPHVVQRAPGSGS